MKRLEVAIAVGFFLAGVGGNAQAFHVCRNGLDDDGDGAIDLADPGCASLFDGSERSFFGDPALPCDNLADDDGDGFADAPADPGCNGPAWPLEDPACDNGRDDEAIFALPEKPQYCPSALDCGDGFVDWPADLGCDAAWDLTEVREISEGAPFYPCDDGVDNVFEGGSAGGHQLVDVGGGLANSPGFPSCCDFGMPEPGCFHPWTDPSEAFDAQCDNGLDDDGDGLIDAAVDFGCCFDRAVDDETLCGDAPKTSSASTRSVVALIAGIGTTGWIVLGRRDR